MEPLNQSCSCLNDLTPTQMKKADAVAGGDFAKLLIELQIVRSSFSTETTGFKKGSLTEFKRPQNIMNVFFSDEIQEMTVGDGPYFLEKKFPLFGPSIIKTMV
jgi:hypothetical protein